MKNHADDHARRGRSGVSESPLQSESVRHQLAQLFGEGLFGPWPQLREQAAESWQRRRSPRCVWGLGLMLLLAAGVFVVRWLVQPGLEHQADARREHYVRELRTFLGDGDLERASQFLNLVERHTETEPDAILDAQDPHLDLIVATEAALYRYFDASPARLRRIRPYLEQSTPLSPLRQIAAVTVLSREERAQRIRDLERLRNDMPERTEIDYLLATALEHRGQAQASREAWERSAKLEPAWLGHRLEQAWFELRQERPDAARQIASDMARVDADSPWSKLALEYITLPQEQPSNPDRADAAAPRTVTPVQIHFQKLTQAIVAAGRHEFSRATQGLAEAAAAVQHQAPFLLDAFDWCMGENEPALARELTEMPAWPRGTPVASAKLERFVSEPLEEPKRSPLQSARSPAEPVVAGEQLSNAPISR